MSSWMIGMTGAGDVYGDDDWCETLCIFWGGGRVSQAYCFCGGVADEEGNCSGVGLWMLRGKGKERRRVRDSEG